ncbi:TetR/AcrR family transcriptional regulator [Amycolatopsis orientalis]|uniref:TetR/AcrR family transcriptional regulator n=1 Tax=Amycolatopsis orientalis TaxID=31958 RepID=UPI0005601788|nr:TetR/AcrR family transcriptional regulator [Amycolatopsis orientalis]
MTSSGTPPDGRATRWAGQRERRRREFVEAGMRAIARYGPDVSTEQIADEAGVARTRIYKHFADAADLQRAIALRAAEMISAQFAPLWGVSGTPREMVHATIGAHIEWLSEHRELYQYLMRQSVTGPRDVVADVKTAIARQLSVLFEYYLGLFGADQRVGETIAYGLVGLVESSTAHWLDAPRGIDREDLRQLLARWVWSILDDTLRTVGVELNPDSPLSDLDYRVLGP